MFLIMHLFFFADCYKLSVIVRVLGLMDKFKRKMATYKFSMEQQEAKLEKEMEGKPRHISFIT